MDLLTALSFPDTVPDPAFCRRLLLFFDKTYHYQANEAPFPEDGTKTSHEDAALAGSGLCSSYAPAPLGEDLERFNHLVKDLQNRQHDYRTRLAGFSTAAYNAEQLSGVEASTSALTSVLSGQRHPGNDDTAEAEVRENLWRARLVLRLAEILDRQNREISSALQKIRSQERDMFKTLKGITPETGWSDVPTDTTLENNGLLRERIKAWAQLFLAEKAGEQTPVGRLLATGSPAAAALLRDSYETLFRHPPATLFTITLPEITETGVEYLSKRSDLRTATRNTLEAIGRGLREIASSAPLPSAGDEKSGPQEELARLARDWQAQLRTFSNNNPTGGGKLTVYCFQKVSMAILFSRTFGLNVPSREQDHGQAPANGLLAVFERS